MEERLRDLNERYEAIAKRIDVGIPGEIIETKKKIEEGKWAVEQALRREEEVREKRQGLLAAGVAGDEISKVNLEYKKLWEACDEREDMVVGLKAHLEDLDDERIKLLDEKNSLRDAIIEASLAPLLEEYNAKAKSLSETFGEIFSLMDRWGMDFGEATRDSWGRFFKPSSWMGLKVIAHLAPAGEDPGEDFFNLVKIFEDRAREENRKAFEKASQPKRVE
ncbi:MAG: hypothetical protein ACLQGU_04300 [bacterium]